MTKSNALAVALFCNLIMLIAACTVPTEVVAREDAKKISPVVKASPIAPLVLAPRSKELGSETVSPHRAVTAVTEPSVEAVTEPAVETAMPKLEASPQILPLSTFVPAEDDPSSPTPRIDASVPVDAQGESVETPVPATPPAQNASAKVNEPALGIRGTMSISFGSRLQEGGVDTYDVDLVCADALRFKGKIVRQPREVSSILGRETKPQELQYHLVLSVINPANKSEEKRAGVYSGNMKVTGGGVYDLSPLKISASLPAYSNPLAGEFGGRIRGKAQEKKGIIGATYTRLFGGKKVALVLKNVDPLAFENVRIAAGPLSIYSSSDVSGNLDFDYDTGNWITSGLVFKNGAVNIDTITGSIKWVPDENRLSSGKSRYEFNLRYNESQFNSTTDEASFFATASDEEAFFAVDERIPTLKGSIQYKDTFGENGEDGEPSVVSSEIEYSLEGDKVTKDQLISFLKWWLLIVGPVNDE